MNTNEQILFIKSPISSLLKKIVNAVQILGDGMGFYAVNEYLLQSMFLQLTGAQEQKMKCICWALATNNLEYRYKRFYQNWDLSECSTLKDKTKVFDDIYNEIIDYEPSYTPFIDNNSRKDFINKTIEKFKGIFENRNISIVNKKKYKEALQFAENLTPENLMPPLQKNQKSILIFNKETDNSVSDPLLKTNTLLETYGYLYRHRNRCAHNTKSYQLNLPHLDNLRDSTYQSFDNIFIFFIVLIIIDEIAIRLFEKYESLLKKY